MNWKLTVLINGVEEPFDAEIEAHRKAMRALKRQAAAATTPSSALSMAVEAVQHAAGVAGSLLGVLNAPGLGASAARVGHTAAEVQRQLRRRLSS